MKAFRFLGVVVYTGYLVNVGLLLLILPWSQAWDVLIVQLPVNTMVFIDSPWFRGILSAFGFLHIALVAWELVTPVNIGELSENHDEPRSTGSL